MLPAAASGRLLHAAAADVLRPAPTYAAPTYAADEPEPVRPPAYYPEWTKPATSGAPMGTKTKGEEGVMCLTNFVCEFRVYYKRVPRYVDRPRLKKIGFSTAV